MCKPNIHKAFRKKILQKIDQALVEIRLAGKLQQYIISEVSICCAAAAAVADALYVHNTYRSAKQKRFYYYDLVCNIFVPRKTEVNLWKCHLCFVITATKQEKQG